MDYKKLIMWISVGFLISIIIMSYSMIIMYNEDLIKTPIQKSFLASEIRENNLKLLDSYSEITNSWATDKNIYGYHQYIIKNYVYSIEQFNCEYWALTWALYLEKHSIDYKFVTSNNHIFTMAYFEDGYIILDGKELINMRVIK